jgi:hypothetical protein
MAPADPQQLYMVKTNNTKQTTCELDVTPPTKIPNFDRIPLNPLTASLRIDCTPQITLLKPVWQQVLCTLQRDGTNQCPIDCPVPMPNPEPDQNLSERSIDMTRGAFSH